MRNHHCLEYRVRVKARGKIRKNTRVPFGLPGVLLIRTTSGLLRKLPSITAAGGLDCARINSADSGLGANLGILITAMGPDRVCGQMPVDERTRQPYGLLHGGASVSLAETLGSIASHMVATVRGKRAVGLEINANHVGMATEGWVFGVASPIHLGRTTHVWHTEIRREDGGLVSVGRLTTALIDAT